jgi:hypothetical protein
MQSLQDEASEDQRFEKAMDNERHCLLAPGRPNLTGEWNFLACTIVVGLELHELTVAQMSSAGGLGILGQRCRAVPARAVRASRPG